MHAEQWFGFFFQLNMLKGNSLVWKVCGILQKKPPLRILGSLFWGWQECLVPSGSSTESHSSQVHNESRLSLSRLFIEASKCKLKSLVQFFPYINFCSQVLSLSKLSSAQRIWNMVSNVPATANFSRLLACYSDSSSELSSAQPTLSTTDTGISGCVGWNHGGV